MNQRCLSKFAICVVLSSGLFFIACKPTKIGHSAVPTLTCEHPIVMDIPVTASWVAHLNGVNNASVLPQVTGYIQSQNYINGAFVKQGELLFCIDDSTFRDSVRQAQGVMDQATAQLDQLNYNLKIYAPLVKERAIAQQTYEDTRLNAIIAQGKVKEAEAALALAQKNLSYTQITAPFDGIAGISQTNIGDLVSPESGALTIVSSVNPIRVNFSVTQSEWLKQEGSEGKTGIHPGSELNITMKDGTAYPEKAVVVSIDRAFSQETGTIQIQANLPNPSYILRPGMFVIASAVIANEPQAMTVPKSAIISTQGKYFVVTLDGDGHPNMIPINVGVTKGESQQIVPLRKGTITDQSLIVVNGILQAEQGISDPNSRFQFVLSTPTES